MCDLTLNEEMNRLIGIGWTTEMEASRENLQALQDYQEQYRLEVNIVGKDGVIVLSSVPEYVGFDLHGGEQGGTPVPRGRVSSAPPPGQPGWLP